MSRSLIHVEAIFIPRGPASLFAHGNPTLPAPLVEDTAQSQGVSCPLLNIGCPCRAACHRALIQAVFLCPSCSTWLHHCRCRLSSEIGKGQCPDRVLPVVWAIGVPAVLWGFRIRLSLSTEMVSGILRGDCVHSQHHLGVLPPSRPSSAGTQTWKPSHSFISLATFKKGFVLVT